MQPARIMLVDHEPPTLRRHNRRVAAGFGGLLEIPLLSIGRQVSQRHDSILQQSNATAYRAANKHSEPKPPAAVEVPESDRTKQAGDCNGPARLLERIAKT